MSSSIAYMVCLANSRKLGGRCIAGLRWDGYQFRQWLRPVSGFGHGELYAERFYTDGTEPKHLDVIKLALLSAKPQGCHIEDHVVDPKIRWSKWADLSVPDLEKQVTPPIGPLWVNAGSTSNGENDCIPGPMAESLSSSLALIRPRSLDMVATREGWAGSVRRRVRGHFTYGRYSYIFSITDPTVESEFAEYEEGETKKIMQPLLCLSIGELFEAQNACYKLIAGVIGGVRL